MNTLNAWLHDWVYYTNVFRSSISVVGHDAGLALQLGGAGVDQLLQASWFYLLCLALLYWFITSALLCPQLPISPVPNPNTDHTIKLNIHPALLKFPNPIILLLDIHLNPPLQLPDAHRIHPNNLLHPRNLVLRRFDIILL